MSCNQFSLNREINIKNRMLSRSRPVCMSASSPTSATRCRCCRYQFSRFAWGKQIAV